MMNSDQGGLSYLDWAAMTPWQRDDYCIRFNEYQKKRKADLEKKKKKNKHG
jgi:hypothetical protein